MTPARDITDADLARVLSHPLRPRILAVLEGREASPKELAAELEASLGVVSYHVRILAASGLIELVSTRRRRGATQHYYRALAQYGVVTGEGDAGPDTRPAKALAATLAAVSAQLTAAAGTGGFRRSGAHATRTPLVLDDQAFVQVAARLDRLSAELKRIGAAAERRLKRRDGEGEIRATAVLLLFETPLAGTSTSSR